QEYARAGARFPSCAAPAVCVQVQPRMRYRKISTGIGTPSSHSRIQPTLPACTLSRAITLRTSAWFQTEAEQPMFPRAAPSVRLERNLILRAKGTEQGVDHYAGRACLRYQMSRAKITANSTIVLSASE